MLNTNKSNFHDETIIHGYKKTHFSVSCIGIVLCTKYYYLARLALIVQAPSISILRVLLVEISISFGHRFLLPQSMQSRPAQATSSSSTPLG